MKTKTLKWALAVFGLGLVAFFACKPSEEGYEGPLEFAVLQSGDYTGEPLVTDYYTVCQNHESYAEMWGKLSLPGEPEQVDFNAYSVLCIVDTLRPFPSYQIGVSGVNETADYVEVQVERTVDARVGGPVQAYALVRVPRISKDLMYVNLPFETGIVDPYMPELGTSDCPFQDTCPRQRGNPHRWHGGLLREVIPWMRDMGFDAGLPCRLRIRVARA